jgi:copper homeostasis protein
MAQIKRIKLEICTASPEDCVAAERGGADRVELNCGLMLGGLTPSIGTLRESLASIDIPLIAMIRPRAGGFCYSPSEFRVMLRDAEIALSEGAAGIAFGILTASGRIDLKRCCAVKKLAGDRELVFHRAFDVLPDPLIGIEALHGIGVTRIMTSGQEASAYNGVSNIANYIRHAAGRIQILPAGGINRFTVADVIRRTDCDQIHASLTKTSKDRSVLARPQVSFGGVFKTPESEFTVTDSKAVAGLRREFDDPILKALGRED